jgi:hypothetical protein
MPVWPALSPNSKTELSDLIGIVFEKNKLSYGFQETDLASQIIIGIPFNVYVVPEKNVELLMTYANAKEMSESGYLNQTTHSIVYVENRPVCLVEYFVKPDGYHVGGFSATPFLDKINHVLINSNNPILLTSYLKGVWYFTDQSDSYKVLNQLSGLSPQGPGKSTSTQKSVMTFLQEINWTAPQKTDVPSNNR